LSAPPDAQCDLAKLSDLGLEPAGGILGISLRSKQARLMPRVLGFGPSFASTAGQPFDLGVDRASRFMRVLGQTHDFTDGRRCS
jgi:hypothetical protein